jgi:hypothetical protein
VRIDRWHVSDDKQLLTAANQPEFTARELLDGRRVFTKSSGFLPQTRIFCEGNGQGLRQRPILLPRLPHGQQPFFADKRFRHEHADDKDQQVP